MGRASSAKKVARAARAGGKGAKVGRERSLLFPGAIVLVVVLGLALVVYARSTIDPAEAVAPGIADHWHQAYGLYVCGEFLPDMQDTSDPNGIHTHADGVIHVHPGAAQQVARTGDDATLEVFLNAAGASISDTRLDLPENEGYDPSSYVEGENTCGDEDAIVQVAFWFSAANTDEDPEIITSDLANIQFNGDGGAYTIAFAPEGADIPPPNTAADLPTLGAVDGGESPTPSTVAPGADASTTDAGTSGSPTTVAPTTEP
jgi:hypothetical protein